VDEVVEPQILKLQVEEIVLQKHQVLHADVAVDQAIRVHFVDGCRQLQQYDFNQLLVHQLGLVLQTSHQWTQ